MHQAHNFAESKKERKREQKLLNEKNKHSRNSWWSCCNVRCNFISLQFSLLVLQLVCLFLQKMFDKGEQCTINSGLNNRFLLIADRRTSTQIANHHPIIPLKSLLHLFISLLNDSDDMNTCMHAKNVSRKKVQCVMQLSYFIGVHHY